MAGVVMRIWGSVNGTGLSKWPAYSLRPGAGQLPWEEGLEAAPLPSSADLRAGCERRVSHALSGVRAVSVEKWPLCSSAGTLGRRFW